MSKRVRLSKAKSDDGSNRDENPTPPEQPRVSSARAIRLKCLDCTCGSQREVRLCTAFACPLWPFRMGKRPDNPKTLKANEDALALWRGEDVAPHEDHDEEDADID